MGGHSGNLILDDLVKLEGFRLWKAIYQNPFLRGFQGPSANRHDHRKKEKKTENYTIRVAIQMLSAWKRFISVVKNGDL